MDKIRKVAEAWCDILCLGLTLLLTAPAAADAAAKTYVIGAGGLLSEWAITSQGTLTVTRVITAPNVGEFQGLSPTGEDILYTKPRFNAANELEEELYLADREGQNERHIPHIRDRVFHARWDWTGRQFLFLTSGNRGVWVGDVRPDKSVRVREVADGVMYASFSPEGKQLLLGRWPNSGRPGLWLLNLADDSERLVSPRVNTSFGDIRYAPEWTADGRYVLFVYMERRVSEDLQYQHPFWVLDMVSGTEHHLKLTAKIPDPMPMGGPLPTVMSPIFWSERGDRVVYWQTGPDGPDQLLVSLSIDLKAMAITEVEILGSGEPEGWLEQGKLLLVEGPAVVDLTGSKVRVIREASAWQEGSDSEVLDATTTGTTVGPCPVTDERLYQVKYCRPIAGGEVISWFSHSNDETKTCDMGRYNHDCAFFGRSDHLGIDFAHVPRAFGGSIFAAAPGTVLTTSNNCAASTGCDQAPQGPPCPAGGNWVRIGHLREGTHFFLRTWYFHMQPLTIEPPAVVSTSTVIGQVGDTGRSTTCHVHFSVRYKDRDLSTTHTHVDPYFGSCNWIREGLWLNEGSPSCQ